MDYFCHLNRHFLAPETGMLAKQGGQKLRFGIPLKILQPMTWICSALVVNPKLNLKISVSILELDHNYRGKMCEIPETVYSVGSKITPTYFLTRNKLLRRNSDKTRTFEFISRG